MNNDTFRRLEFDKVLQMLRQQASFPLSAKALQEIGPLPSLVQVEQALSATDEAVSLLKRRGAPVLNEVWDIAHSLKRARLGSLLSAAELLQIALTMRTGRRARRWMEQAGETLALPTLLCVTEQIADVRDVEEEILRCLDEQAEVKDEASGDLAAIRREMGVTQRRMKERLEEMIRSAHYQKMLQDPIITQRSGHYVLSVKAPYRNAFGGVVHDQSASGATLFIEPERVAADARRVQDLQVKERKEVEKILQMLSAHVAERAETMAGNLVQLTLLDLHLSKGRLALAMKAVRPRVNQEGRIRLHQARHPLLAKERVVPLNLTLGFDFSTLVITGPNTGGKTVTLKTLGLFSCMAMTGLFVPAEEGTELAVFQGIFADIGDEQSIEQNLSTFSSHMTNIIEILRQADGNSLLLFDELGAGTDPQEGAAIAVALLDEVHARGCRVAATTHYSELKAYAYNRPGVSNASVEFDVETLRPTYRLLVGIPGRSNAFAIAERLGMPAELLAKARQHLRQDARQVEQMMASLLQERSEVEREREQLSELRRREAEREQEWERLRLEREREQQKRLAEERERFRKQMESERQKLLSLIAAMEERMKQEQTVKPHEISEVRRQAEEMTSWTQGWMDRPKVQPKGKRPLDLQVGSEVYVPRFQQRGAVVELLEKGRYLVLVGAMKVALPAEELELPSSGTAGPKASLTPSASTSPVVTSKLVRRKADLELDLRGQRVEEALLELEKFLDHALLTGLRQVTIIHGMGTGALRRSVHEALRSHRSVRSFRLGGQGEGGLGVTLVELD